MHLNVVDQQGIDDHQPFTGLLNCGRERDPSRFDTLAENLTDELTAVLHRVFGHEQLVSKGVDSSKMGPVVR